MKILVVGAGQQGTACLWDLARQSSVGGLGLADRDPGRLEPVLEQAWARDVRRHVADVTDRGEMTRLLGRYDVAISAVPYVFNERLTTCAIEGGCHLVDMGGNTDIVRAQQALDGDAREAGVAILPDGGLAPGLGSVLAGHLIREESPSEVRIRVGGLPQHPEPPLGYRLFFSPYGLLNEYAEDAVVLRGGRVKKLRVLDGEERLEFPGLGTLEAALTSGGASTTPYTFEGVVQELDYKTIRFPGHFAKIRVLRDLGFLEDRSISVPPLSGGDPSSISLRDVVAALIEEKLGGDTVEDQVVVRVSSQRSKRVRTLEIHDLYDTGAGMTAMRRCTAFPVAIEALMLGGQAKPRTGVLRQETDVDAVRMIAELRARGIDVRDSAGESPA